MKLFCTCGVPLKIKDAGIKFVETNYDGTIALAIYHANRFFCSDCDIYVIVTADVPYIERPQPNFQEELDRVAGKAML